MLSSFCVPAFHPSFDGCWLVQVQGGNLRERLNQDKAGELKWYCKGKGESSSGTAMHRWELDGVLFAFQGCLSLVACGPLQRGRLPLGAFFPGRFFSPGRVSNAALGAAWRSPAI